MQRYAKSIYKISLILLLTFLSGCSTEGLMAIGTDKTLPKITQIKYLVSKGSVGFEWPAITDSRVEGIKVYRAIPELAKKDQKFIKITTIDDRYATHYVDKNVKPNTTYMYTFTTFSHFKEGDPGKIIKIKTIGTFAPVNFIKTILSDHGVVKVLWNPHSNPLITGYILQRKVEGSKWQYLARITSRLMPEYIDKSAAIGHTYSYRIIAVSGEGIKSEPSQASTIEVK